MISSDSMRSQGDVARFIGDSIIWLSLIAGVICVFTLGRVEAPVSLYSSRTEVHWVPMVVVACIAAALNGVFFGYLLSKVGSILGFLGEQAEAGQSATAAGVESGTSAPTPAASPTANSSGRLDRIATGRADYTDFEQTITDTGGHMVQKGSLFDRHYEVTLRGAVHKIKSFDQLAPWFAENVIPHINDGTSS